MKFLNSLFFNNPKFLLSFKQNSNFSLKRQQKFCSKTRIVNRCILTNRSRGLYRKFNISRILMRKLLLFGVLSGYSKSVW
ncbi:MAG: 30S ribosomal protein S14 [Phenylobacterium zucineum]|nr:MAG: 30S ribosomal protein S14 [Phenylobacterium zucineum]